MAAAETKPFHSIRVGLAMPPHAVGGIIVWFILDELQWTGPPAPIEKGVTYISKTQKVSFN